jgi:hypothetical protein
MSNFILSLEFGGRGNTDSYYLISQEMLEFSVMCSIKQRNLARAMATAIQAIPIASSGVSWTNFSGAEQHQWNLDSSKLVVG